MKDKFKRAKAFRLWREDGRAVVQYRYTEGADGPLWFDLRTFADYRRAIAWVERARPDARWEDDAGGDVFWGTSAAA